MNQFLIKNKNAILLSILRAVFLFGYQLHPYSVAYVNCEGDGSVTYRYTLEHQSSVPLSELTTLRTDP